MTTNLGPLNGIAKMIVGDHTGLKEHGSATQTFMDIEYSG